MMYRLFLFLLLSGALLLSLSACSDPTGVGGDLGGGSLDQADPQSVDAVPSSFGTTAAPSQTGFDFSSEDASNRSWRFLAGAVNDPISGVIEAEGYIDFLGTEDRPLSVETADVASLDAELRLTPTYLHGDTISTLNLNLYTLGSEVEMHRLPADTSFAPGTQLSPPEEAGTSYLTRPGDSLVTLSLPDSWIEDHLQALKADTFGADVNGFILRAANRSPTAAQRQLVAGFDLRSASLRLMTPSDTVDFTALKTFTHIERRGSPDVDTSDRTLIQDGVGTGLSMTWDFERPPLDSLKNTPLNRVDVTVPIDTTTMEASLAEAPLTFSRPQVNLYKMTALRTDGADECRQFGFLELRDNSEICRLPTNPSFAPNEARLRSQAAFDIFERSLFETPPFTTFRVEIANQPNPSSQNRPRRGLPSTVPVLVRTASPDTSALPRVTLTVTPL